MFFSWSRRVRAVLVSPYDEVKFYEVGTYPIDRCMVRCILGRGRIGPRGLHMSCGRTDRDD